MAKLYEWYVTDGEACSRNAWLVSSALVSCAAFTGISLHPVAKEGSLLPSAVVTAYCVYLCYSALSSEPSGYRCNPHANHHQAKPTMVTSMVLTLLSVVYSALRAGSSDFFGGISDDDGGGGGADFALLSGAELSGGAESGEGDADDEILAAKAYPSGPVTYSYSFFHFIFALASMYLVRRGERARGRGRI